MTLIAGVVARKPGSHWLRCLADEVQAHMSRFPSDEVQRLAEPDVVFLKVDIGVYGETAALRTADGKVGILAGRPVLDPVRGADYAGRGADLVTLHDGTWRCRCEVLRRARGAFCAAHWDPRDRDLTLVTDKSGTRPLYYYVAPDLVVFASALRILRGCPSLALAPDPRGALEAAVLGYPLSDRTAYSNVAVLRPGEAVRIGQTRVEKTRYWSWDAVAQQARPPEEAALQLQAEFQRAVQVRVGSGLRVSAFLSGGLDSRCVVAALRQIGKEVHTFNFSLPGQQDSLYARQFAEAVGARHTERDRSRYPANPPWAALVSQAIGNAHGGQTSNGPALVWSGDGGSVALGCVYMSEPVVAALRQGDMQSGLRAYLEEIGARMPRRIVRARYRDLLFDGLLDEARSIDAPDDLARFHLLLMRTDQFRHLHAHFEDIDLSRVELQLPFLDGRFLECVLSEPVDRRLRHGLYHGWLGTFDPAVSSVAWQTYPGHLPCPIPDQSNAVGQWGALARSRASSQECAAAARYCRSRAFVGSAMSRTALAAAALLHRAGLCDGTHAIRTALKVRAFATSRSLQRGSN